MAQPVVDDTRGIVHPEAGFERFRLTRHEPSPALAWAVERYWVVRWDVGDEPFEQKVVPHPANHLVFEGGRAEVEAISRDEFVRRLEGRGQVLGVKFRPAGFRPFLARPVSTIAGDRLPASAVPAIASASSPVASPASQAEGTDPARPARAADTAGTSATHAGQAQGTDPTSAAQATTTRPMTAGHRHRHAAGLGRAGGRAGLQRPGPPRP